MDCKVYAERKQGGPSYSAIALVGNPNVGKSCLFNHFTGLGATVSNFPGTTVDITEGTTTFGLKKYLVADLPGSYSLDYASPDEEVTRKYLANNRPQVIINVVNALQLERNLYLSLDVLRLGIPVVIALNFYEEALARGISIDTARLSHELHAPVIPIDAVNGLNVDRLMQTAVSLIGPDKALAGKVARGKASSAKLAEPKRIDHKETAKRIARDVTQGKLRSRPLAERLSQLTTEPATGYIILFLIMAILFASLFFLGDYLGRLLDFLFTTFIGGPLKSLIAHIPSSLIRTVLDFGLVDGLNAAIQIAIPYIAVFYVMMAILEDSGYLPRMAYLLDKTMHRIGLHGKSVIPLMLGFGCSVPAIFATRILPSKRERITTAILINLIPCSARTAVVLGAAGKFIGWPYALLIYLVVLILIFLVGFFLGRYLPGSPEGLVLEMPEYRLPRLKNVLSKTWLRLKDFVFMATPMVIGGSMILGALINLNLLEPLTRPLQPIISGWLMLPPTAGVTLIYGILRKELALEMLVLLGGSSNLLTFMTPLQIFIFSLVVTLYFPCVTTFTALRHEFGMKAALAISLSTIVIAVLIGGLAGRLFMLLHMLT